MCLKCHIRELFNEREFTDGNLGSVGLGPGKMLSKQPKKIINAWASVNLSVF